MPGVRAVAANSYPQETVTLIVPFGEGGGTDTTGRVVANLLRHEVGAPVRVVNIASRAGVDGHRAMAQAAPDGYTLGIMTANIWLSPEGLEPRDFTALARYNADYAAVHVAAESPFQSADDLVQRLRSAPGTLRAGGATTRGIWHRGFIGLLQALGLDAGDVPWLPANNAAVGLDALRAGQLDLAVSSVPEAANYAASGDIRTLAVLGPTRSRACPDVPTVAEATGLSWDYLADWRGVVAPAGLPASVRDELRSALARLHRQEVLARRLRDLGFTYAWEGGPRFQDSIRRFHETVRAQN